MKVNDVKIKDTFDYLTLLEFVDSGNSHKRGLFRCVCGKEFEKYIQDLFKVNKTGQLKSCGCKKHGAKVKLPKRMDLASQLLSMAWR
jgi:hypothetical protein